MKLIAERLAVFVLVFVSVVLVSYPLKAYVPSDYFILALAFCTGVIVMVLIRLVRKLFSQGDR